MQDPSETTPPKQGSRWKAGQSGNPAGRPKGARHAALLALDAIGAEGANEVMAAVVTAAKAGDMRAADILLRRLWPERKGRPAPLDLPPLTSASATAEAVAAVAAAVASGDLSPEEGQAVAAVVETHRKAMETADLAARVAALEAGRTTP